MSLKPFFKNPVLPAFVLLVSAIHIFPITTDAQSIIPYSPSMQILNDDTNSTLSKTISDKNTSRNTKTTKTGTNIKNSTSTNINKNPFETPLFDLYESIIPAGVTKLWQDNGGLKRNLKKGDKGDDVLIFQLIIRSLARSTDKNLATKNFGPKTEDLLKNVQASLGLTVTGKLDSDTRTKLNDLMLNEACPTAIHKTYSSGFIDPSANKMYENLNRKKSIPLDYIPQDLIKIPDNIKTTGIECVSNEILPRVEEMFSEAKKQGIDLAITSGYRSAETQKFLYSIWIKRAGESAKAGIAEAGHSEHQLGTTIDVSGKSIGYASASSRFGNSKEGKWMAENSYKYGFIMSYPDKKQKETGYIYEPWHFRFIGIDNAKDIFNQKITIQEFLSL